MEGNFSPSEVEAEIAQLSEEIAARRRLLESQRGIVEEKEVVRAVVAEKFHPSSPVSATPPAVSAAAIPAIPAGKTSSGSYLDSLDDDTVVRVNALVEQAFTRGIAASLAKVRLESPYVLDAFHDALVDKLYAELKARGVVK